MYLRIKLCPRDKSCHRFLWQNLEIDKKPGEYEFNRLVFGINTSPFLAQFVVWHPATMFKQMYPKAAETILKSTYMDDSMDSIINETEKIKQKESVYTKNYHSYGKRLGCMHISGY